MFGTISRTPTPHLSAFAAAHAEGSFDVVVGDLSFISLTLVLPTLKRYLAPNGNLLMLVKPQFETRIRAACAEHGLKVRDYFQSAVTGTGHGVTAGNIEFFVWAQPIT